MANIQNMMTKITRPANTKKTRDRKAHQAQRLHLPHHHIQKVNHFLISGRKIHQHSKQQPSDVVSNKKL